MLRISQIAEGEIMASILYTLGALACGAVLAILLNRTMMFDNEDIANKSFKRLLVVSLFVCLMDALWGLVASHTIMWGNAGVYVVSALTLLGNGFVAFTWLVYVERFLENGNITLHTGIGIALFSAQIVLLIVNLSTGSIFIVNSDGEYCPQRYRIIFFGLQYVTYLYAAIRTAIVRIKTSEQYMKKRCEAVVVFSLVPLLMGMMQYEVYNAPFYSIGYMLAATVIFIYNVSSEHERLLTVENQMTKYASRQNKNTINALATIYESMVLVDIVNDRYSFVRRNKRSEDKDEEEPAGSALAQAVRENVDEKDIPSMLSFTDLSTLQRRMQRKTMIAHEYLDKEMGWCKAYFIRVESEESGALLSVLYAVEKIDEEKRRELEYQQALAKALENQNEVFAEMLQMQSNGIVATDMNNKILKMNDAAAKIFGYPSSDAFEGDVHTLIEKCETDKKDTLLQSYTALKAIGGRISFEFAICNDGLNYIYVMAISTLAVMTSGEKIIITSLTNITRNKKLEHELTMLSETDALTGIRNRGSGEKRITDLVAEGTPGMFALMDIDKFKTINDTFGHGVGDKVLIAMGKCLAKSFRGADIVMRLGGDEFAVYAVGVVKPETVRLCISRLFEEVEQIDIEEMRESGRKVSISLGAIVCTGETVKTFDELYQQADAAMYGSKRIDGNHYGTA